MMRNSQVPEKVKGWTNFWRFQRKTERERKSDNGDNLGDLGNNQGHKLLFHPGLCFLYYSCLFEDIKLNMFSVEHIVTIQQITCTLSMHAYLRFQVLPHAASTSSPAGIQSDYFLWSNATHHLFLPHQSKFKLYTRHSSNSSFLIFHQHSPQKSLYIPTGPTTTINIYAIVSST